ncbi:MAG TPA: hypothetical protein DCZ69_03840 [Syntrophobacteraceae bacterium]|nr:hypothetical protein [Syntrophobacteraceae bacterium]HBZ56007.1 hypothetical protein [Syntrophobacteraceae bacterium]
MSETELLIWAQDDSGKWFLCSSGDLKDTGRVRDEEKSKCFADVSAMKSWDWVPHLCECV